MFHNLLVATLAFDSQARLMQKGGKEIQTHFHKCKRMNLNTPKGDFHFRNWSLMESWMFRTKVQIINDIQIGPQYTIKKVLKHRYWKWTHISIWSFEFGIMPKKKLESN
jgi:hypothetical protein